MKSSIEHLPVRKQRELTRIVEVLHQEFDDAVTGGTADFKKKGRILKIVLFGSYARGDWVDEIESGKGYRSDFDLLVVVNNNKLADPAYWAKAEDRMMRDPSISTPVSLIIHGRRYVNTALRGGQYFFTDIRREGIILYELDNEPLAKPGNISPSAALERAKVYFENRISIAHNFERLHTTAIAEGMFKEAAFLLHQAIEHAYAAALLVRTSYSPPSHNLKFLRALAEDKDPVLVEAWPRNLQRYSAWFSTLNEAYVKARYSEHYSIGEEALSWLGNRTLTLIVLVEKICREHLAKLQKSAEQSISN